MQQIEPQPHTVAQPGLRGHSFNPDDNLLKQFRLDKEITNADPDKSHWLAIASFDDWDEAQAAIIIRRNDGDWTPYRIVNQFEK